VLFRSKNSALTLEETIRSIQIQVFENWELIIVVGPSEDDSLKIAMKASTFDERIKVIQDNHSKGIAEACNIALEASSGEFVAICNADDINMPNRFLAQQSYLLRNPEVGVLGSNVQTFGKRYTYWNLPTEHAQIAPTMLFRGSIANPTAMIRRQILLDHDLNYDANFNRGSEDLDLWERLSCLTELKNLNFALIKYRISDSQLSAVTALTSLENARKVRERILSQIGITDVGNYREIHNRIADNEVDIDIDEVSDWFERIEDANLISNHFSQNSLSRVLEKEKFMIIERNLKVIKHRHVNTSTLISGVSARLPLSWKIRAVELLRRSI
jgi:glycosyltransferase involved in cell wall biosynthesis